MRRALVSGQLCALLAFTASSSKYSVSSKYCFVAIKFGNSMYNLRIFNDSKTALWFRFTRRFSVVLSSFRVYFELH